MLKFVPVLLSLLFVSSLAFAEVFQCVGKYGEALYQNFPCQFESSREIPTDVPDTKKSVTDVVDIKKSPTNIAGQKKPLAAPPEPRIGMTTEEVRAMWGEPTDSLWEEPGDGDLSEIWSYGDSRSVRFDRKRRVAAVQQ